MFHRSIHCLRIRRHTMTKFSGIKTQSMHHAAIAKTAATTKKEYPKSMLPWDATTFLILALLVRALFLLSVTPWFVNVWSFELKPSISKHSSDVHQWKETLSSNRRMKMSTVLCSTMVDYSSTSETDRKALSGDEILSGASKTTQLLLQTPPVQTSRQRDDDSDGKRISVPTKEKTLYEILGTAPTATKEELKRQYIVMAKLTHPDALISRQNRNSIEMFPDFTEVADAYQILSNPVERKKYDRTLHGTQLIQVMVLLGDICIGTTLTVAEITSAMVWVTLMVILQPIAVHVTTELFYLSIDDSSSLSK